MNLTGLIALCFVSLTAAKTDMWGGCGPPPGMNPNCDALELFPLTSKPDCRVMGCPSGQVCCKQFCTYHCQEPSTWKPYTCPYASNNCKQSLQPLCQSDSDCKGGKLCCTVRCRKQCVKGRMTALPM